MTLSDVIAFLEENGKHISTELTAKKVVDRGVLLKESSAKPGIFFELERHQAVLGGRYVPRVKMNAFVAPWEKYFFDGKDITCVGESRPPDFDREKINYHGVALWIVEDLLFYFDANDDGSFEAHEANSGDTSMVSTLDEAADFGRKIVGAWDLSSYLVHIEDFLAVNECQEVLLRLNEEVAECAGGKARNSLEGYMSELRLVKK